MNDNGWLSITGSFFCGSYSKAGCLKLQEERRMDVLYEELKEPNCEAEQFCAEKETDYSMDSAEYLMLHSPLPIGYTDEEL
jgi:hypothetical protein